MAKRSNQRCGAHRSPSCSCLKSALQHRVARSDGRRKTNKDRSTEEGKQHADSNRVKARRRRNYNKRTKGANPARSVLLLLSRTLHALLLACLCPQVRQFLLLVLVLARWVLPLDKVSVLLALVRLVLVVAGVCTALLLLLGGGRRGGGGRFGAGGRAVGGVGLLACCGGAGQLVCGRGVDAGGTERDVQASIQAL